MYDLVLVRVIRLVERLVHDFAKTWAFVTPVAPQNMQRPLMRPSPEPALLLAAVQMRSF
jgi:hypothetical protein